MRYTIHKTGDFTKAKWVWQIEDWEAHPPKVVQEFYSQKKAEQWIEEHEPQED